MVPDLVSVVVPAFNARFGLKRCIDSILSQTYENREVIVVNDGSTDDTEQIAASFSSRIRYLEQRNLGETSARNRGFAYCRGEFITFLDHDDWWEAGMVASCVEFLRAHPSADVVSVGSSHLSAFNKTHLMPPDLEDDPPEWRQPFVIDNFFDFWSEHLHVCSGSVVMRRSLLEIAGGQRPDLYLSGDMEFWAHLANHGQWGFIPEVLTHIDGTQAAERGDLYSKYSDRYRRAPTIEDWQSRVVESLAAESEEGFRSIRGLVTSWLVLARIFIGEDDEAWRMTHSYRSDLQGRMGRLFRGISRLGRPAFNLLAIALRIRFRSQYRIYR